MKRLSFVWFVISRYFNIKLILTCLYPFVVFFLVWKKSFYPSIPCAPNPSHNNSLKRTDYRTTEEYMEDVSAALAAKLK